MGIILDTSVLIAGERRGESVQAILQRVQATHGEQDAALSVVTLVEVTGSDLVASIRKTAGRWSTDWYDDLR